MGSIKKLLPLRYDMKKIIIPIVALLMCGCEPQDIVENPDHSGSVDISINTTTLPNNTVVYTTTSKVYSKNILYKTIVTCDTLPSLGFTKEEGENSNGDVAEITIPKEYEIYITVK